jgi:uncharacterized protein
MISLGLSSYPTMPFHEGEVMMQKRVGTHDHVMSYAPRFIRPRMPDQHRQFYEAQPFLVVAARDDHGLMWSTLLQTTTTSPDDSSLIFDGKLVPGDALDGMLTNGTDVGVLGIEFATRRRNRVNGRIVSHQSDKLTFKVDQSFGNCPQYIKPRQWWIASPTKPSTADSIDINNYKNNNRSQYLSIEQMDSIRLADTIFLASGYRGDGEDQRYGNDASHRGGQAGFVLVLDNKTLILPDYSGNNHFNTIGNLIMDPRIGISFPQYETGAILQVSGHAEIIDITKQNSSAYPGAERLIKINIDQVVDIPAGTFPIRWSTNIDEIGQRKLVVSAKVNESDDVISFHLRPKDNDAQELWKFHPGQHLPIHLPLDPIHPEATIERTYTNSAGPSWGEYRISVKRQGKASTFLHDKIHVGDTIVVDKPAGDFILNMKDDRPIVLLSNGIGITPMISMLHYWASNPIKTSDVWWIHGARDGQHHPFVNELQEIQNLVKTSESKINTHVAYTQPRDGDVYDSTGRLTIGKIQQIVPDWKAATYYVCGTDAFVSFVDEGLKGVGVPATQIHYETF